MTQIDQMTPLVCFCLCLRGMGDCNDENL